MNDHYMHNRYLMPGTCHCEDCAWVAYVDRAWTTPPPVDVDAEIAGLRELADQLAA